MKPTYWKVAAVTAVAVLILAYVFRDKLRGLVMSTGNPVDTGHGSGGHHRTYQRGRRGRSYQYWRRCAAGPKTPSDTSPGYVCTG